MSARDPLPELPRLFHQLNNQLGVILANAELLERQLRDAPQSQRAGQLVGHVLDAISTAHTIRLAAVDASPGVLGRPGPPASAGPLSGD